jgi:hypothetical protein
MVGVGFLGGSCGRCEQCRGGDLVNCRNQKLTGSATRWRLRGGADRQSERAHVGLEEAKPSADILGLEVVVAEVSDDDRFAEAFTGAVSQSVNGVVGMASPFFNFHRKRLVELSSQHQLPSIWEAAAYARWWPSIIRTELLRYVPPSCRLCCQDYQGRSPQ